MTTVTVLINWSCLNNVGHSPPTRIRLVLFLSGCRSIDSQQRCLKNEPQPHYECAPILLTNGSLQDLLLMFLFLWFFLSTTGLVIDDRNDRTVISESELFLFCVGGPISTDRFDTFATVAVASSSGPSCKRIG